MIALILITLFESYLIIFDAMICEYFRDINQYSTLFETLYDKTASWKK